MPSAAGENSFSKFGQETPYGALKRLKDTTQAAPMAGAPVPALTSPRRAQKTALRPSTAPKRAQSQVDYPTAIAQVWLEMASHPGASPLVQEYAARAQQELARRGAQ